MSIHRVPQVYLAIIFLFLGACSWQELRAQSADVALTPPMGWNSWNHFNHNIDDKAVRAQADAMVSSGMRDAGYTYINIDDTWEGERDAQGYIQSNSKYRIPFSPALVKSLATSWL